MINASKSMFRNQLIFFALIFLAGCHKDDHSIAKTSSFQIFIDGMDPITFYNPECEFNNVTQNQAQFNGTVGDGYNMFCTYWNKYSTDSTLNQIWIDLRLEPNPPSIFHNLDSLPKYLTTDVGTYNDQNLRMILQMEIGGVRYYNELWDADPNLPPWQKNDSLNYVVQDYEIFYHSECISQELVYVKLQIEGKLYAYDFLTKIDSIQINNSVMELLFAAD